MQRGTVEAIQLAAKEKEGVFEVGEVHAVAGRGLEGDRYFVPEGQTQEPKKQITLFEAEAADAVNRDYEVEMVPADTRRNIVTRGISLNHLVGVEFRVGEARLRGIKLCEPCSRMQRLADKKILKPLIHRGGLNAEIVTSGTIRTGDLVEVP